MLIHHSNLIEDVDEPDEDKRSTAAWFYIIGQNQLTYHNIMAMHGIIMSEKLNAKEAGHVRTQFVTVGGRACPAPDFARDLLNNWILDMEHYATLDPKEMHIRFEHIHPFIDGNGRSGRMLMWWHESKLGREPTFINYRKRSDYYEWFDPKPQLKPIPKFKSEDEEREFWQTHDSTWYVPWSKANKEL